MPSIRDVEEIFFQAMKNGYAENAQKISMPDLPASKAIHFDAGNFKVIDYYFVSEYSSEKSTGTTTIWYKENPVWIMYYGGWYAEVAIPFLKKCLSRAYTKERFYGGRGPQFLQDERFTYINRLEQNNFEDFKGEEIIYDISERCFGWHWYRGMSLLPKTD